MAVAKKTTSSTTLTSPIFAGEVNPTLLAQAIRVYLSNQRQGTSKVKTRSEVSRTKKKWFKQKHTGNARHGSRNAHIFVGGGVAHGPTGLQNWSLKLTQRMKQVALLSALSSQKANTAIIEDVAKLNGKTKEAVTLLKDVLSNDQRVLVILPGRMEPVVKSLRNLPQVLVAYASQVNVWELAVANKIVTTSEAITELEKRVASVLPSEKKSKK